MFNENKNLKEQKGAILILVVVVMMAIFLLINYYLQFIITETKISNSHNLATKTYYLSEAGVQEAMWKIKNDNAWLTGFQTDPGWQETITRNDPFGTGGTYTVTAQNNQLAHAEITASSTIDYGQQISQRRVKTVVFQPQGLSSTSSIALLTDDDTRFTGASVNVVGGGIFANDDINLDFFSEIDLEGTASAVDQISVAWGSSLTASEKESVNYPPAPERFDMPQVDFDSVDPGSFLSRADNVYSTSQFNQLIINNPNLTLSGITYVTGNVIIPRGAHLTVDGVLVLDGNLNIGTEWWPFWDTDPSITVTDPGSGPVGIVSKRKVHIGSYTNTANITGLIYVTDELKVDAYGVNFSFTGGIIGYKVVFTSIWLNLTLVSSPDLVIRTIGTPLTAPIINIEHWEEEY